MKKFSIHLDTIKKAFEERCSRNPNYSLRSFARDLELSPAALSGLLNGKKGISEDRAKNIAKKLKLTKPETELFVMCVIASYGRSPPVRERAAERVESLLRQIQSRKRLSLEKFEEIQSWYHFAILELLEVNDYKASVDWFAQKLQISDSTVREALTQLEKVGMIVPDGSGYKASANQTITDMDVPHAALKNYHKQMFSQAEKSLASQPVESREFLNMTMAFPRASMEQAKTAIREFQESFARTFYSEEDAKDSVYQLSIQFFRLDQEGEEA